MVQTPVCKHEVEGSNPDHMLKNKLITRPFFYFCVGWTRQAVGQQHNNNTPATYVLEVRRAFAQLLLVNRAGRELLHLSLWFPNPSTERDGSS